MTRQDLTREKKEHGEPYQGWLQEPCYSAMQIQQTFHGVGVIASIAISIYSNLAKAENKVSYESLGEDKAMRLSCFNLFSSFVR
jgi:hypothetical protein